MNSRQQEIPLPPDGVLKISGAATPQKIYYLGTTQH